MKTKEIGDMVTRNVEEVSGGDGRWCRGRIRLVLSLPSVGQRIKTY